MSEQDIIELGAKQEETIFYEKFYWLSVKETENYVFQEDTSGWYAWRYESPKETKQIRGIGTFKNIIKQTA